MPPSSSAPPVQHPGDDVPVLHSALLMPLADAEALPHRFTACLADSDTFFVPADACLRGHFSAPSVHIKGTVHGSLTATRGPMVIDRGAKVHGRIDAWGTAVIAGQVFSRGAGPAVISRESLQLACTAQVLGGVRYVDIAIYEGAQVEGALLPWTG